MILKIESITLKRSNKILLVDFNLNINKSQIIILTGDNGVGKSTLIEAIAGLQSIYKGKIVYFSKSNKQILYIGHSDCLKPELSILDNLSIWCDLAKIDTNKEKCLESLKYFGIAHLYDRAVKKLSEGQKKKVILTKLLHSKSKIFLLDEPLSGLDLNSKKRLCNLLSSKAKSGKCVILSTHEQLKLTNTKVINLNLISNRKNDNKNFNDWEDI